MDRLSHDLVVVDDTLSNLAILTRILQKEGYSVRKAENGEQAIELINESVPDLILLDMILPGINGLDVCRYLQKNTRFCEIPVIFITAVTKAEKITEAFNEGAVDYVVKPFNKEEVLARVKTHLRLSDTQRELKRLNALALDANPLTRLPGNNTINSKLQEIIDNKLEAVVIYVDLDNFKPFNDVYGYLKGDEAIKLLADILNKCVAQDIVDGDNFIGNVGGDDFVLILPMIEVERIGEDIKNSFDAAVQSLYTEEDLKAGGINATDRKGNKCFFSLLSLSMGGIYIRSGKYAHVSQIAAECAEVKKKAKQIEGTNLYMDNRK